MMTTRHGNLNVRLWEKVDELYALLVEYKELVSDYDEFMENRESEFDEAGEDAYDDEDFETAMEDGENFTNSVDELENLIHCLHDISQEIAEPSLEYANNEN